MGCLFFDYYLLVFFFYKFGGFFFLKENIVVFYKDFLSLRYNLHWASISIIEILIIGSILKNRIILRTCMNMAAIFNKNNLPGSINLHFSKNLPYNNNSVIFSRI